MKGGRGGEGKRIQFWEHTNTFLDDEIYNIFLMLGDRTGAIYQ